MPGGTAAVPQRALLAWSCARGKRWCLLVVKNISCKYLPCRGIDGQPTRGVLQGVQAGPVCAHAFVDPMFCAGICCVSPCSALASAA